MSMKMAFFQAMNMTHLQYRERETNGIVSLSNIVIFDSYITRW